MAHMTNTGNRHIYKTFKNLHNKDNMLSKRRPAPLRGLMSERATKHRLRDSLALC